jgi:hypothetical protein
VPPRGAERSLFDFDSDQDGPLLSGGIGEAVPHAARSAAHPMGISATGRRAQLKKRGDVIRKLQLSPDFVTEALRPEHGKELVKFRGG